jgi:hypothetical protein
MLHVSSVSTIQVQSVQPATLDDGRDEVKGKPAATATAAANDGIVASHARGSKSSQSSGGRIVVFWPAADWVRVNPALS